MTKRCLISQPIHEQKDTNNKTLRTKEELQSSNYGSEFEKRSGSAVIAGESKLVKTVCNGLQRSVVANYSSVFSISQILLEKT
jgi:hypothetical protein